MRVSFNDSEVGGCFGGEDGGEFGGDAAEGDALVAGGEGVFECGEAYTGAGTEEGNGFGVRGHCGGCLVVLWRCKGRIAM